MKKFHVSCYKFHVLSGFTLIELLVSISIFVVIAGAVVANLRGGTLRDELILGAENAAGAIREAKNLSSSGAVTGVCALGADNGAVCPAAGCAEPGVCSQVLPLGGYGVRMELARSERYILFADIDGNNAYGAGETLREGNFIFSKNVRLNSFVPDVPVLEISFRPPRPSAYIDGGVGASFAEITFGHRFLPGTRKVRFERVSGAVSAQ